MHRLVLLRHGQSVWNTEDRFAGWTDVELSARGIEEARQAGRLLRQEGLTFDLAFTSVLKRAIRTLWIVLEEMDLMWVPIHHHWRLNERHYGALQGLNKAQTAQRCGRERVKAWRRSYDVRPPELTEDDARFPGNDPIYLDVDPAELPRAESLKDTIQRFLPYWHQTIAPAVRSGKRVLISGHCNSLRALVMHLDNLSPHDLVDLNIPTGIPLLYELDDRLVPLASRYLGDPQEVASRIDAIAAAQTFAGVR